MYLKRNKKIRHRAEAHERATRHINNNTYTQTCTRDPKRKSFEREEEDGKGRYIFTK